MASPVPAATGPAATAEAPFNPSTGVELLRAAVEATPSESPSPEPEAPAVAPEQAVESPSTQQTSPATTPEQSPEANWLLEKFNGDVNAASKWAVETNNRASQQAAALKAAGIDPQTLQPITPEPEPVPQTQPSVQIDDKAINDHAKHYLGQDNEAKRIAQTYGQNEIRIEQIATQSQTIERELTKAILLSELPDVANDAFRRSEVTDKIRELKLQLSDLKTEKRDLAQDQKGLAQQHREIADWYRGQVKDYLTKQETARQDEVRYKNETTYYQQQFAQAWPNALDKAITDHKIPSELHDDFKRFAKSEARAFVNGDGNPGYIEDVGAFVANVGKDFAALTDKSHRIRSAHYGALATQRATVPGPNGTAAVAPSAEQPVPQTIADLKNNARNRFAEGVRNMFGR